MTGLNVNLSVFKRVTNTLDEVDKALKDDGWSLTGSLGAGERIKYYEQSGINITAIGGPAGTVVIPSGPVRGMLFGNGVNIFDKEGSVVTENSGSRDTKAAQISSGVMT